MCPCSVAVRSLSMCLCILSTVPGRTSRLAKLRLISSVAVCGLVVSLLYSASGWWVWCVRLRATAISVRIVGRSGLQ